MHAGRRLPGNGTGSFDVVFSLQVGEYPLDHHRVFDADNNSDGAAACPADLDVNVEHALEPLRPGD